MPFRVSAACSTHLSLMLEVFQEWRIVHLATQVAGLQATTQALKTQMTTIAPTAISKMKKEQLVTQAYLELEMTEEKARAIPGEVLKLRLQKARKAREIEEFDPMAVLPRGFRRMSHDELRDECKLRGIDFDQKDKKAVLMEAIMEQVDAYTWGDMAREYDMEIVDTPSPEKIEEVKSTASSSSRCRSPVKEKKFAKTKLFKKNGI